MQGFEASFESLAPLPDGDYEIEVTLPDETFVCQRTFPPDDTIPPGDCASAFRLEVGRIQPTQSGPTGFFVSTRLTPETVGVTVRYEGTVLADETFNPEYRPVEICGARCQYASERVTLPTLTSSDAGTDAN